MPFEPAFSRLKEIMAAADRPGVVAEVVLQAARAARLKIRYTAVLAE